MKILKQLSKFFVSFFLCIFFANIAVSNEPVDIWNIDSKENLEVNSLESDVEKNNISENSIYEMQSEKEKKSIIQEDETLISKKIEISGLYDPSETDLTKETISCFVSLKYF